MDAAWDILSAEPRLALDTESNSFHRYFERVCLIQLGTPTRDFFVDPFAVGLPDRLRTIFSDVGRTMVMHGADYDVRILKSSFGAELGRIFDTSLAAAFLGLPAGLKPLLEAVLGVIIDKGEQRSDWGKRPLSESQLLYARQDVLHLLPLAERLEAELEARGRREWHTEECALLRGREPAEKVFDPDGWRAIKGAKALGPAGRSVLSELFVWRESEARTRDLPPFRVARNDVLLRVAQRADKLGPRLISQLNRFGFLPTGLGPGVFEAVVERGLNRDDPGPAPRAKKDAQAAQRRLDPEGQARLAKLRTGRVVWAERLALDAGFLIPGAVLERVAREPPRDIQQLREVSGMTEWRVEAIGTELLEVP